MKLAQATFEYIENHPSIRNCLKKGLINYSALARQIAKELDQEKESSFDAIIIACRRFSEKSSYGEDLDATILQLFNNGKFEIRNRVSVLIIDSSVGLENLIQSVNKIIQKSDNFHLIQGTKTFNLVIDDEFAKEIELKFKPYVIKSTNSLVQLTHKTDPKIKDTRGFLTFLTGLFADNGINIYEAVSSWTDTIFLIDKKDTEKAVSLIGEA